MPALSVEPVRGALVPAVQRAISLLERLASQREPMSLARLASELSLPKSSVHGLCNTLQSSGYLRRQDDGTYRLGPRVMGLAEAFVASTGVAQEFNAIWQDSAAPLPEDTVVLSVLSGAEVIYVALRNGTRPLGLAFNIGMRLPAYLAATGKVQLAYQPEAVVLRLLGEGPLPAMAGPAPVPVAQVMAELARVRQQGFSVDDQGVREGVHCMAAPVFDAAGRVVAGIGVCIHQPQLATDGGARHRAWLLQVARALSRRLGGDGPLTDESGPASPGQPR